MLVYKRKNQSPASIGREKKDSPAPRSGRNSDSLEPNHRERLAACGNPSIMDHLMYKNPKFLKAMVAMKKRGFSSQISSPVVKNLLESLDKNWELIEQENYQVLADAIRRESEATEVKKKHKKNEPGKDLNTGVILEIETERPTKKLRSRPQEILSSPVVEPTEVAKESSDSDCEVIEPPPTSLRNSGKQHVAPLPRKVASKKRFFEGLSNRSVSKDPEDNLASTSALLNSKNEPLVKNTPQPEVPIIVIDPEPLVNGNSSSEIRRTNCQLSTVPGSPPENLNVNVSLTCNISVKKRDAPDSILELGNGSKIDTKSSSIRNIPARPSNGSVYINSDSDAESDDQIIPKWSHDPNDITKGQEKVMISFVNGPNNESPPHFHYIPNSAVFQNARISFSLARIGDRNCCSSCSGNCLSSADPCACSYETGGEYAYTAEGLVKGEFIDECVSMNRDSEKHCMYFCQDCPEERSKKKACKGHLIRKFIKECWSKCGCNMQCGNRVVQHGISRKLQVFMASTEKGWGLRTLEELPKGAFVCEYVGEVITNDELDERNKARTENNEKHSYPVQLDADWSAENYLKDEEALCLDATNYGNVARFINHRCVDSTLVEIPVEIETPDHHYYHLAFFTTRKVAALEELTWDYGIDFADDEHPVPAFLCKCGSRFCKDGKKKKKPKPRAKIRGIGIK